MCDVNRDGIVMLDVSPRAYIVTSGPPRISSPTMSATPPLLWTHLTFSRNPQPPRLRRTTLPEISALSCNDWISA